MSKFARVSIWTVVPLAIVVAVALVFFLRATEIETTDTTFSQLVGLAAEGRVQEIRVQATSAGTFSTGQQVRFTALLYDGSEVIGRAESQDAIRAALNQAGVADADALLKFE